MTVKSMCAVGTVLLLLTATAACGASVDTGARQRAAVLRAARAALTRLGHTPRSGVRPGTTVVFTRMCFAASGKYASVLAVPVNGKIVGQPGLLYARETQPGFETVGGLVTGDRIEARPIGVPASAYARLHTTACLVPPSDAVIIKLRHRGGQAVITIP